MADRGRKAFPISSALIFEHDCEQRYKIHRNSVRSARALVNTAPPEDFLHFHYNAKKCMQQADRLFDVERANRILLEKMTKYAEYSGARDHRPWAARGSVNFRNGLIWRPGTGLHIDNLNVPVNKGTVAAGRMKTEYQRRKELEDQARESLRVREKITSAKAVYSTQKLQHEYLESVSRIDRLSKFRGPGSASHRSMRVREHLDVAKSMRMSLHRPGTAGYQKDLAQSIKQKRSQSACTSGKYGRSESSHSASLIWSNPSPPMVRPPRAQSAVCKNVSIKCGTGIHAYVDEAARCMKRASTLSRSPSKAEYYRANSAQARIVHNTPEELPVRSDQPVSGRPFRESAPPLLTPDSSVTMVFGDESSVIDLPNANHDRLTAAPSLMSHAPQGSLNV